MQWDHLGCKMSRIIFTGDLFIKTEMFEKISVLALILLITGAIDSVRNLPAAALFGSSLIFFFLLSAIIFLIPVALVSAELASTWSEEEGGIYSWVKAAFGENIAFFSIWLQWVNTVVWYPTILSFIAATLAYLINPNLAQNKTYLIAVILIIFWSLTFLGQRGLRASAKFAGFCAIIGLLLPIGFFIVLAAIWVIQGKPIAIEFSLNSMIPHWGDSQSYASLTAVMTSFLGMELAAVHVRNIHNPQRNFPRAIFFSAILILVTMILGALAIALVLPEAEIGLVNGVMQAFTNFFQVYNLSYLMPVVVILLLLGSLGGMINWIIAPAKGMLLAAQTGFLPAWLHRLNKHGIAARILFLQAILVSALCGVFLLFPSVNAIYWLFAALSTELYMVMYVLMFLAAWRLKSKYKDLPHKFVIPGGVVGYYLTCILGLIGCLVTLIVGFMPPQEHLDLGGALHFRVIFVIGILLMLAPAFFLYLRKKNY